VTVILSIYIWAHGTTSTHIFILFQSILFFLLAFLTILSTFNLLFVWFSLTKSFLIKKIKHLIFNSISTLVFVRVKQFFEVFIFLFPERWLLYGWIIYFVLKGFFKVNAITYFLMIKSPENILNEISAIIVFKFSIMNIFITILDVIIPRIAIIILVSPI